MHEIKHDPQATKAYAEAHAAHYTDKDLKEACRRYGVLIAEHPSSKEAQYSRSQIDNIAKSVVPATLMLNELMSMIGKHLPAVPAPVASDEPSASNGEASGPGGT